MRIARREDFALIFMSALTKYYPKGYVSLSQVARERNLSSLFLKHIASVLLDKKLIKSKEGIGGGYKLAKDPGKIFLSEIISTLSSGIVAPSCVPAKTCRVKREICSCRKLWYKVNQHLFSYLEKISLFDFAKL